MHYYRIFDLVLASPLRFPEIPVAPGGAADLHFSVANGGEAEPADITWRHRWIDPSGAVTAAIGTCGQDYVIQFPQAALFVIAPAQGRIRCHPVPGYPTALWRHLLLDQVIPQILAQRGELVAHASAALIDGACACFLGESGAGKSTLAAALGLEGQVALADDGVILRPVGTTVTCIPSYPGARFWPDSLVYLAPNLGEDAQKSWTKRRILQAPGLVGPTAAPLAALFFLNVPGQDIRVEPVSGAAAMVRMIRNSFLFDVTNRAHMGSQFALLGQVLATGPRLFCLTYPRDYARLPEVCEAVVRALGDIRR